MEKNLEKIKKILKKRQDTLIKAYDLLVSLENISYSNIEMTILSEAEELSMQIKNIDKLLKK